MPTFDSQAYAKRLRESGVTPPVADVMAEEQLKLFDTLATKEDLRRELRDTRKSIIIAVGGMIVGFTTLLFAVLSYASHG